MKNLLGQAMSDLSSKNSLEQIALKEADIRETRALLVSQQSEWVRLRELRASLAKQAAEMRRDTEENRKIQANAEREMQLISNAKILLEPSPVPLPIGPRKIFLLLAALFVSLGGAYVATILAERLQEA